jgi:hypothetical protein
MADFLDEKRREIADRLRELKPLVDEYQRLEAAAQALQGVGGAAAPARRGPGRPPGSGRRPGRPAGSGTKTRTGARRGRRRGSGTRAAQALKLVRAQPGITIPELADKMKIKQNYLYRVLPGLAADGLVAKEGRGWHPKGSS